MLPFAFTENSPSYDASRVFYARIDPETSLADELLRSLYYILWFPGYFGFNWDALYDCLRDLSWIPCKKVVLVHESLPKLNDEDLRMYLEVLRDSVLDWHPGEDHVLEVNFRSRDECVIRSILSGQV
ncbi:barstar family protein [Achromobacter ruhlandii]|uniref:barstar family protein n=1 Tax=Achromobacter ruhlandii TaxID=72557 RepID=UPI0009BB324F